MIEFAKENHIKDIKILWKNAFGDEDISEFLKCYEKNILIFTEDGRVCGMLSMLPISLGREKGRYIYAVATDENFRNRGISTKLLNYARKYCESVGEKFLILVPAKKSLFEFYEKRGYTAVSCVKRKEFSKAEYDGLTVEKITAKELFGLRKEYFKAWSFAEWSESDLEYISTMYDGNFYRISGRDKDAFAVCSFFAGTLEIKELCPGGLDEAECASALMDVFGVGMCIAAVPSENGEPFAMIYPEKDVYFNLAMD